jgi:Tc toxin complex TcA C-terminal TcB-binding domain/Neuraminidase-like domain/Salmonella virulence plasmid 28.1kDa A protein
MPPDELEDPRLAEAGSPPSGGLLDVEILEYEGSDTLDMEGYLTELPGSEPGIYEDFAAPEEELCDALLEASPDATPAVIEESLFNVMGLGSVELDIDRDTPLPPASQALEEPEPEVELLPQAKAEAPRFPPAPGGGVHTIRGQVAGTRQSAGDIRVEAFHKDLRTLRLLGAARTDIDGRYEIPYRTEQLGRVEGAATELVVRASHENPSDTGSAQVQVRMRAGDDVVADLSLAPDGVSEWELIATSVLPLLAGQGDEGQPLSPWELDEQDIDRIAEVAGLGQEPLRIWALAARAVHDEWPEVALHGESPTDAPQALAVYGWFRDISPQPLDHLLHRSTDELMGALERASAQAFIPTLAPALTDQLRGLLDRARVQRALRPATDGQMASLGDALRMVPEAERLHLDAPDGPGRRLASLLAEATPEEGPRWVEIREVIGDNVLLDSVQRSLKLRTLTRGYAPLMQALQRTPGQGDAATLVDLVTLDEEDWVELAQTHGVPAEIEGATDEERCRLYGRELARAVERMHPTPFIQYRIADDRIPVPSEVKDRLETFLSANPTFKFAEQPVLEFLESDDTNSGGLTGDQIKTITPEFLTLERVARLAPSLEYVGGLLASGYRSARDVVFRHSREVFVDEVRHLIADEADAGRIYDAAAGVVATTEALVLAKSPRFAGPELPVMLAPSPGDGAVYGAYANTAAGTVIQPPNLRQLFGNQDYCECAHGASLLGPAAYLADLLQMLARRPKLGGRTALQVLLERRPDLAELDLSGDNADITLPYIDLALEILETPDWEAGLGFRVLRGGTPQNPTDEFDADLDKGQVPAALAADLATWALPLGEHRTAVRGADVQNTAGASFRSWLIRDRQSGMKLRLLGVIPGAYRLRAYPQSVAGMADGYRPWPKLLSSTVRSVSTARFPWTLPFDVTRDEANRWLAHLGATREQVMLSFAGSDQWTEMDPACEHLDVARAERDILISPPSATAPDHRDWGFPNAAVGAEGIVDPIAGLTGTLDAATGNIRWDGPDSRPADPPAWHALLKNVSLLRSRAGLTHRELLAVLETRFVRAGGARLDLTGDECNPALMRMEQMSPALARRLHLFVRLWRQLGWATTEVDQAIQTGATNTSGTDASVAFTEAFLLFVANIARLHAASGVSITNLIDLFGGATLDTTRYWDHAGAQAVLTLSRYEHWFDNPTLGRPQLPEFRLDAARSALEVVAGPSSGLPKVRLSDHHSYLAAALGLTERELASLLPTGVTSIQPTQVAAAPTSGDPIDIGPASLKEVEVVVGATSVGAAFSLLIEHADDDGVFVAVPAAEIGGTNPIAISGASNVLSRFSYSGTKRYLRTSVSSTAGANPTMWMTARVLTSPGFVTDELSLANLTTLCRCAVLRRVFDQPIQELRTLMQLSGINPLAAGATPDVALDLLEARDVLATLGLSITEADALLRGPSGSASDDLERGAEAFLTTIRTANGTVHDESTVTPDQRSVLLAKVLTNLGWDEPLVARVLSADVLATTWADYSAPLDAPPTLPAGASLPASVTYDTATKRLTAPRSTRPAQLRAQLAPVLAVATGALLDALTAIDTEAARREAALADAYALLRAKKLPTHRAHLGAAVSLTLDIPSEWEGRFYHDRTTNELCFVGWMTAADAVALKALAGTPPIVPNFAGIIDTLRAASISYQPATDNRLTVREGTTGSANTELAIEELLLDTVDTQERSGLILGEVLPGWRRERLRSKVDAALAQLLGSSVEVAAALLDLPAAPPVPNVVTADFASLVTTAPVLASDPATRPSRVAFPDPFDAAARLLVLGELAGKLRLDQSYVPWFRGPWSGLDLTHVPTTRTPSPPLGMWASLATLSSLLALRAKLPPGAAALREVLAATSQPTIDHTRLAGALGYDEASLRVLGAPDGLDVSGPAWLREPTRLLRLVTCLELARTLNVPAELLVRATRVQQGQRPLAESESEMQALRQAALGENASGGGSDEDNQVLDEIRLRRRDATVDYLVQTRGLRDANDLYGYALIDPDMGPCMMTSRMVQAINSVQLFVQRCLMQLEPDAPPSAISKDHWEWMKNYRVWEANRKVLLHPENWIEPELRDDKTPFFDELVSSLQQGDASGAKAELALQRFLEQLTDFSKMEVVGTCSAYDDQNQLLITHIFARTLSEPHAYFYRQFRSLDPDDRANSLGIWTSWQAISLDIEGDHLIPVVWQGRLFLFWAIFSKEAVEPSPAELKQGQTDPAPPRKLWRFKLAWSEYKSGTWTSRRLAQEDLWSVSLDVAKQTQSRREAADTSDWFYFLVSAQEDGVTITSYWLSRWDTVNLPISPLFFDGQRVVRARGSYAYVNNTGTYKFIQTPSEAVEAPVDTSAPEGRAYIDARGQLVGLGFYNHYQMSSGGGSNADLILSSHTNAPLKVLTKFPRNQKILYAPTTGLSPFAAPSPRSTGPIAPSLRTTPFFVSDWLHGFFIYPVIQVSQGIEVRRLHFYPLNWLQAPRLRKALARRGVDGLLSFEAQDRAAHPPVAYFSEYNVLPDVVAAAPDGDLEFSPHSASSTYNFELFFHVPFAIACSLSKNQRFEEARRWFHYIFDPTDSSSDPSPARYWRFRPFRESQDIELSELLRRLADPADASKEKLEFQSAIAQWKDDPFKPHLVARMRLRSYMYVIIMKYLDNLLDWADQLFRRDTMESINEATQLYILAAQILGRRPEGIPRRTRPVMKAYTELAAAQPDDLTNALVECESLIPNAAAGPGSPTPGNLWSLYFCLPNNPRIDEYYDRVEDKLFKLRNCMNIDGVVRELALFEPPIDPALLVKAAAAGMDLAAVIANARAPLPLYRFTVMAQKATELCAEVKSLGASLLSAIEKGDAEALARMRAGHERDLLRGVRILKETQLLEAKTNMDAIGVSLQSAQARFTHYVGLVSQLAALSIPTGPVVGPTLERLGAVALETLSTATAFAQSVISIVNPIAGTALEVTRQLMTRAAEALSSTLPAESMATTQVPLNPAEQRQLSELKSAHDLQQKAADQRLVAQGFAMIPDFTFGAQGAMSSPVVQLQLGGTLLSKVANFAASITDSKASEHTYRANLHSMLAGYQRRADDWMLQAQLASLEITQLGEQLKAATLRVAIASQDLANHDLQTAQSSEQQDFMRTKFSNQELYSWMSGQLATLYFDAYQLAYDVAKRAERCFANELGVDATFIKFGYWDSLRKGLLAGEALFADLKRMEVAYLSQNAREFEITKHVSLRELDPAALVRLRETGECQFTLPEVLFDLDFAGHYFRRIKSVAVSVPCVVGPYTGVSGTLTLLSSKVRIKSNAVQAKYSHDENFRASSLPVQAIATSSGQNDTGMFELNFRDERYLPFEGAGVISKWRFELPGSFRTFDYSTISDLVLHVRYTARQGGGKLKELAEAGLINAVNSFVASHGDQGFARLISLRQEFPSEWHRFVTNIDKTGGASEQFVITKSRFPFLVDERTITVKKVDLYGVPKDPKEPANLDGLAVTPPEKTQSAKMNGAETVGRLRGKRFDTDVVVEKAAEKAEWVFTVPAIGVQSFRKTVEDILVLFHYSVSATTSV